MKEGIRNHIKDLARRLWLPTLIIALAVILDQLTKYLTVLYIKPIPTLPLWEGDKIFLRLLETDEPFFSLKLKYEGETLVLAVLNGERLV